MNSLMHQIQNWPELAKETNWHAAALAKKCGVSVRTLERYLLKQMGKSPKAWLAEQRQLQAFELLGNGLSVKEAATSLGYAHATQFSHNFKRYWGKSPTHIDLHRCQRVNGVAVRSALSPIIP